MRHRLGILAILLAATGGYLAYQRIPAAKPKTYTLRLKHYRLGQPIGERIVAKRSDGTTVRLERFHAREGGLAMQQRFLSYSDGYRVRTWDYAKLRATETPRGPALWTDMGVQPPLPSNDCVNFDLRKVATHTVQRLTLVELQSKSTGHRVMRALQLGCEDVDLKGGYLEIRLDSWQAGEPDDKLFDTIGYAESDPHSAYIADLKASGATPMQLATAEKNISEREAWRRMMTQRERDRATGQLRSQP